MADGRARAPWPGLDRGDRRQLVLLSGLAVRAGRGILVRTAAGGGTRARPRARRRGILRRRPQVAERSRPWVCEAGRHLGRALRRCSRAFARHHRRGSQRPPARNVRARDRATGHRSCNRRRPARHRSQRAACAHRRRARRSARGLRGRGICAVARRVAAPPRIPEKIGANPAARRRHGARRSHRRRLRWRAGPRQRRPPAALRERRSLAAPHMILVLDCRNSRLKWGLAGPHGWISQGNGANQEIGTLALRDWQNLPRPARVIGVNVAGEATRVRVEAQLVRWRTTPEWLIAGEAAGGVYNRYARPSQLGADRWAALIAARRRVADELFPSSCVMVNAGTAITVDALDSE